MTSRHALRPPRWPSGDAGTYCLLLSLSRTLNLKAGRLGGVTVAPGLVLYIGRARRNLFARLARHMRRRKPRRWHIDYLFPAAVAQGAFVFEGEPFTECEIAERLARRRGVRRIIPGFGASDCRCAGHLLWAEEAGASFGRESLGGKTNVNPPFALSGAAYFHASTW